jgi:pentatricopeptide repeat protein
VAVKNESQPTAKEMMCSFTVHWQDKELLYGTQDSSKLKREKRSYSSCSWQSILCVHVVQFRKDRLSDRYIMIHSPALRLLVLFIPLFCSYTSNYYRSTGSRYVRLFADVKGGYDIESFFKSDAAFKEQLLPYPAVEQPLKVEQPLRGVQPNKKARYNPTSENKKSKYSSTKMRLRSSSNEMPSYASGAPQHVQEMLLIARKGSIEVLLRSISDANNATLQISIANENNKKPAYRLNEREFNMLIRELCDGGRIEHCTKILTEMSKGGIRPSVVTYTTLISRAGAWQKLQLAEMYFRKMIEDGIRADAQAYNSLINAYAKAGETDRAMRVLNDMDQAGVAPTVVTFNTLIESCARTGKAQRAQEVLQMMKKRGLIPDERSFSAVVQSCCQAGQVESAFQLVQRMSADGIIVSSYTYSSLLHGLGKMGDLVRAFEVLDLMIKRGIRPNVVTMSSLVYSCGRHGKLDIAIKIYREMLRSENEEDRPNSITCSSLVDACLKAG